MCLPSNFYLVRSKSFVMVIISFVFCFTNTQANTPFSYTVLPDSIPVVTPDSLKNDTINASVSDDLQSQIKYASADSISVSFTEDKWRMYKNASLLYEDLDLKADYIEINFGNRTLFASGITDSSGNISGKPIFKQGNDAYNVETVNYNFKTKRGSISDIKTQQGEGFIRGEKVIKTEHDNFYISNGIFTTCDKEHPDFCMRTHKLKMVKKKHGNQVITGSAYMEIADVPTPLAIPFGFFPADKGRKSGVIFPAYGESQELGFFLRGGGWYFGINDYVDASITGDIYSKGSWALHGNTSYAKRYRFTGSLGIDYSINKFGEKELPNYSVNKNFFINWRHSQDGKARPGTSFSASVSAGSADYFNNNVATGLNYLTNTFNSSIAYSKTWGTLYNLSVAARHAQNNITHIYEITLPEVGFGIARINPFKHKIYSGNERWYEKIGFSVTSNIRNQITAPDSILFSNDAIERIQNGMQTTIPISTSFQVLKYFTLTPAINLSSKWYLKTYEQRYDSISKQIVLDTIESFKTANEASFSAGLNTRIYGMLNFKKGGIAAIRHVIIPTVGFSIRPDYGKQQFGYYKNVIDSNGIERLYSIFSGSTPAGISYNSLFGGPAAGRYGFLSLGIDNTLEMKTRQITDTAVNLKKVKILEGFSLNTGYNLAATQFKWSVINMAARTTILEKFTLNGTAVFDPYALDSNGIRIDTFQFKNHSNLFRFTNATVALGFSLSSSMFANDKDKKQSDYFKIPWNITFSYSYNYSKPSLTAVKTQTLFCFGDLSMTERWRINFSTGWDFVAKDVSYTQLAIVRDLHCWEMRLSWVPFGLQQNYFFTINVKAGMLRDLKLDKKRDQFDR